MLRSRSSRLLIGLVAVTVLAAAPASASAAPFNGGGITASALVFFPNPVVTSGNLALTDEKDADYPALNDERVAVLLAEQNATMALQVAQHGYVMENGRIVLDGDAKTISQNEDIKEFYLGLTGVGQRKSYRDVKHYRRRKRWLS